MVATVRRSKLVPWLLLRLLAWVLLVKAALHVHAGRLLTTAVRVPAAGDKFMLTRTAPQLQLVVYVRRAPQYHTRPNVVWGRLSQRLHTSYLHKHASLDLATRSCGDGNSTVAPQVQVLLVPP
jgi:hypothetical protein